MSPFWAGLSCGPRVCSSIQRYRHLGFTMLAGLFFGAVALLGFGIAVFYGRPVSLLKAAVVFAFLVGFFGFPVYLITR
ncbi:MAG: hypothetical protein CM1200mP18_22280 [Gammaproteobacteria bacterium]|nr:MAG: hypothetical protein CM1200mP18_22280 [Gammaproteobacteria bacterium]